MLGQVMVTRPCSTLLPPLLSNHIHDPVLPHQAVSPQHGTLWHLVLPLPSSCRAAGLGAAPALTPGASSGPAPSWLKISWLRC